MTTHQEQEEFDLQIEEMIDVYGLYKVVEAIERTCHAKSEHLASNWQDHVAAKNWTKAATVFDRAGTNLLKIQLS
jgi:hypothetical protein